MASIWACGPDLDRRLVRTWALVPAAVDERVVADGLLAGAVPPAGSLLG